MDTSGRPQHSEPVYSVLWPLGRRAPDTASAAERHDGLNGRRIAELWDFNFQGQVIFPLLRDHIRAKFPEATFVDYTHFGNFHGPGGQQVMDELPGKLQQLGCDAVIVGIGA